MEREGGCLLSQPLSCCCLTVSSKPCNIQKPWSPLFSQEKTRRRGDRVETVALRLRLRPESRKTSRNEAGKGWVVSGAQ